MATNYQIYAIVSGSFGVIGAISDGEAFEERLKEALEIKFSDIEILQESSTKHVWNFYGKHSDVKYRQWVAISLEPIKLY